MSFLILMTFKQFSCYFDQQQNGVGLYKITFYIHVSQIDSGAFLVKVLLIASFFLTKLFYKFRSFFINVNLLNNYFYYSIFPFQSFSEIGDFFISNIFNFSFPILTELEGYF